MSTKKLIFALIGAKILFSGLANAAIARDGIWTNYDWYDETLKVGVRNGVVYSNDADVSRRITSPLSVDGSVDSDYLVRRNVERVMSVFSE